MSNIVNLNIDELKDFYRHIVKNNRFIQAKGKVPVAIEVVGESGIGKTSSIIQLADELGLHLVKLNLAQIEEIGDLVGFPIRQFEMALGEESFWIDENAIEETVKQGYSFTGKNRMEYCPPKWIAGKGEHGVLLLDDWNRADIRFIQAVMDLIDRQQYISWSLPKDWHIVLTSNPDNGEYIVNTIDPAQRTRFITTNLKFDVHCWSRWAEREEIDGRCINFLLLHPEIVSRNINARSIVMFFNSISSIENFDKSLPLIQMIGEGSVGEEFSTLFSLFINNKLDKLLSPEEILYKHDVNDIITKLYDQIGIDDKYRADIASTIATRIINYCVYSLKDIPVDINLVNRIATIILAKVFSMDICYNLIKQIYTSNTKFKLMSTNKDLVKYITQSC